MTHLSKVCVKLPLSLEKLYDAIAKSTIVHLTLMTSLKVVVQASRKLQNTPAAPLRGGRSSL